MLTPFDAQHEIDWVALKKLIDWYLNAGVQGLFACCQSSEMFFLSESEALQLVRFIVDYVDGRMPVVASGHTACALSQQIDQLGKMAETGVDSVIMISNRLAHAGESDALLLANVQKITAALKQIPTGVGLGIYECPYPYKRLLADEVIAWCAQSGRYTFIKDTCCDIATIKRRVQLIKGSRLHIANANGQTLLASLQAGCHGYSGVMANFHPELYVWLCQNWQQKPAQAALLSDYLATASLAEFLNYPLCAKDYQQQIGNFNTGLARANNQQFSSSLRSNIEQVLRLGASIKQQLEL